MEPSNPSASAPERSIASQLINTQDGGALLQIDQATVLRGEQRILDGLSLSLAIG